jgi:L-lactate utilization protein LutC
MEDGTVVDVRAQRASQPARDDILGRVRSALTGVGSGYDVPPAPRIAPLADVVGHFAERVEDYKAVVERCAADELADRVRAALPSGARVVVPAGLSIDVPGADEDGADGPGFTAYELDGYDAVVTEARVGIAETGTIVLDHGPGQGRRAISLVPDLHVCIVRTDQVVPDVPDALPLLDPDRPHTWISGPSATSDIELDRVEGVHGPRTLVLILVEPAP